MRSNFPITLLYHACQQDIMNKFPGNGFFLPFERLRKEKFFQTKNTAYFLLIFSREQDTIEP